MIASMNRNLWTGDGSGTNFDGLQRIISTTPTSGTVGGIDRNLFTFWRNRQNTATHSSTAFDTLVTNMRTTYNQCSLGGVDMTPESIITDRADFEGYESTLVTPLRLQRDTKATGGDIGFLNDALQFKAASVFYDEDAPAAEMRFLNKKALKLCYLQGAWMKMETPIEPANQLISATKVFTFGNLTTNGSRYLGVVSGIT
jgi:hypothetical protein